MIDGTTLGTVLAIGYLVLFQLFGIGISFCILKKETWSVRLFFGSVIGSFGLHWLPTLTSLAMQFTVASHVVALLLFVVLGVGIWLATRKYKQIPAQTGCESVKEKVWNTGKVVLPMTAILVLFGVILRSHTLVEVDGALHCGQSTYGDMNMHLGFITSIVKQQTFPPEYSILPGTKLCYPFLSDSISSSLYVFGSSLVVAYMLPMLVAFVQVMGGIYLFAKEWLGSRGKALSVWLLFLGSGGFGMYYFTSMAGENQLSLQQLMEGFYQTPTNLVDQNIRWVNTICDMLIPQRATLFGWAMLFPVLYLLYRATFEKEKRYYWYSAVLAGGLPMIHTHSFLALGIICAGWLLMELVQKKCQHQPSCWLETHGKRVRQIGLLVILHLFIVIANCKNRGMQIDDEWFLGMFLLGMLAFCVYLGCLLYDEYKAGGFGQIWKTWGWFLVIVLVLALPQLFAWTFQQATGDSFVRGHFNWSNEQTDSYAMFYLKNLGLEAILGFAALLVASKERFRVAVPAVLIWFIGELVVFQPNTYDNNKLLFVAYVFVLCLMVDMVIERLKRMCKTLSAGEAWLRKSLSVVLYVAMLGLCCVSGAFSIAREAVSDYELYSKGYVQAAEYVDQTMAADATLLTGTQHNNAIASLTGRNIVCGSGSFLYFHGLDYSQRENAVAEMYANPGQNLDYFQLYQVDYVVIGSYERGLGADEAWFAQHMTQVYANEEVVIYENKM